MAKLWSGVCSGIWAGGLVLGSVTGLRAEWLHPNMYLNPTEIQEIKARVLSGKEPWKSAYAKLIRNADEGVKRRPASLKYSREAIKRDGCGARCTSDFTPPYQISHNEQEDRSQCTDAGYYLIHMALAWHLTGQEKYAEGARKQIDVWYFDEATRMEPKYAGGDDVAGTNSFAPVIWGVDLSWPFLPAEKRTQLKAWHKSYLGSLGAPVRCSNNRCYWKGTTAMMCAIIAEDPAMMARSAEMFKSANMDDKYPGRITCEDKGDKRYMYRMFSLNALHQIVEMGRHHGMDLYTYDTREGRSKLERSWDYYAQFTKDPSLWMKLEGRENRQDRLYNPYDKIPYEIAQAIKPKPAYEYVLSKLNPPRPMLDRTSAFTLHSTLHAGTLTHAAGTYAFKVYDREGKTLGALGSALPTRLVPAGPGFAGSVFGAGSAYFGMDGSWLGDGASGRDAPKAAGVRVHRGIDGKSGGLRLDAGGQGSGE